MQDHSVFYKKVGQKIKAQRGNLSQEALAKAIGLTRTSISNIEKGRQKMLLHTFFDIAEVLKVDINSLLPEKISPGELVGADVLARLPEKERAFVESAIGLKQRG